MKLKKKSIRIRSSSAAYESCEYWIFPSQTNVRRKSTEWLIVFLFFIYILRFDDYAVCGKLLSLQCRGYITVFLNRIARAGKFKRLWWSYINVVGFFVWNFVTKNRSYFERDYFFMWKIWIVFLLSLYQKNI